MHPLTVSIANLPTITAEAATCPDPSLWQVLTARCRHLTGEGQDLPNLFTTIGDDNDHEEIVKYNNNNKACIIRSGDNSGHSDTPYLGPAPAHDVHTAIVLVKRRRASLFL
ncbi:hypothetical protein EVAR_29993_1 [Eumeta japonica]|uniref:Uncharacterized protein n=1 Tax=Eumeta variegata TaxID=151549 RepID=A0A4C1VH46_EUMVA|nr:hypothetical protein EVAR_29993_1 [Eumeta japonica]